MHGNKRSLLAKIRQFFSRKKQLLAAIFIVAAALVIIPGVNRLLAQKVTPSVQTQNNRFISDKEEVQASGGQIPKKATPAASGRVFSAGNSWRSFDFERLVNFTPTPQDTGEYITLLAIRTEQRYEEIRAMDLTSEEKALVTNSIYKRASKQLKNVQKNLDRYLKTLAESI